MRIQFEATLEDYLDVHERLMARSKVARSWQRQGAAATALLSGLLAGVIVFILSRTTESGLVGGIIAATVGAVISGLMHRNTVKRRMYKYWREQFGDRTTFMVEMEITESGIWTSQMGTQSTYEWANVEEIKETEETIQFYMRNGGAVFVRKRAFKSPEDEQQFIGHAQRYLDISRSSSNWLNAN
jgi:hypothetical protein